MNKLVRDKIPDKISSKWEQCEFYIADRVEHINRIIDKLFEESTEIQNVENDNNMKKEIWDLLDVIEWLCELKWFNVDEINKLRNIKSKKLWKFKKWIILTKS
jgi:predicted house-cleaning noncanonical NTP pyrophosphatase (MazG superfamily)